ncbi:Uncharacterised protein [Mycobacteroides abscessus]|nr:Uncharacterised protein [Mycobacteroides abscessus]
MRSSDHTRQSWSARMPHRSSTYAPCRRAIDQMWALYTPTRGRVRPTSGDCEASKPVAMSTSIPAPRRRETACSRLRARRSTSAFGRRMSLPPPMTLTRSGRSSSAAGTCSVRIERSLRPRMARFAYRSGSSPAATRRAARCWARRSAHPRWWSSSPGYGSHSPSVNESPIAT